MLAISFPPSVPIEAVAGLQMLLYGLAWGAVAALMTEERETLLWWSVCCLCQALAVAVALPALTDTLVAPPETLALLLASFAAAMRGVDVFAKPRRRLGLVIVLTASAYAGAFVLLEHGVALTADERRQWHLALCVLATGLLFLTTIPSLWMRLGRKFGWCTAAVALLPAAAAGVVATVCIVALALLGEDLWHQLRSAARAPLVVAALVGSALFNFSHGALFMARVLGRLRHSAHHDYLTRVLNRRAIETALRQEWAAFSRRRRTCLAVFLVDVDHFKQLNDHHGHAKGDHALAFLGKVLRSHTRTYDHVGRWGGEEFLVVATPTSDRSAEAAAERLRAMVERLSRRRLGVEVTVSIGVALADDECSGPEQLVERADQALYQAKHRGRNRVCTWSIDLFDDPVDAAEGTPTELATVPQHLLHSELPAAASA